MIDSTPDPLDADLERWQQHDVVQIRQTCGLGECRQEPRTNDAVMNHRAFYSFVLTSQTTPDTVSDGWGFGGYAQTKTRIPTAIAPRNAFAREVATGSN